MMMLPLLAVALPWLHGVTDVATTDTAAAGEPAWLSEDSLCAAEAQPPLRLTAGGRTITATYTTGIRVENAEGAEIAASPGYPCLGSADSLESLSVGTIFGEPAIILTLTSGGNNEQWTWLGVYRVGFGGVIDPLFAGVVEYRVDGVEWRGSVRFLPGALIYQPPGARETLWVFDPVVHTYVPRGWFGHEGVPHS